MIIFKETCRQRAERLISEGWRVDKHEGYFLTLRHPMAAFPEVIDLRYDTVTIRPDGVGYATGLTAWGGGGNNWACVDETPHNSDTDFVYRSSVGSAFDAYTLGAPGVSEGTITDVSVYHVTKKTGGTGLSYGLPGLRLDANNTYGSSSLVTTSYVLYGGTVARPGGGNWSWADISDVQAVISLYVADSGYSVRCTQVYVVVTYTPGAGEVVVKPSWEFRKMKNRIRNRTGFYPDLKMD